MDTSTEATPLVRAWELLADLASCGQDSTAIHDAHSLVQRIANLAQSRLPCPWGLILLQHVVDPPVQASWGADATLSPGFLQALRSQIELLITLHRRELTRRQELAALNASALSFDLTAQV